MLKWPIWWFDLGQAIPKTAKAVQALDMRAGIVVNVTLTDRVGLRRLSRTRSAAEARVACTSPRQTAAAPQKSGAAQAGRNPRVGAKPSNERAESSILDRTQPTSIPGVPMIGLASLLNVTPPRHPSSMLLKVSLPQPAYQAGRVPFRP